MARGATNHKISTEKYRAKLAVSRHPYFVKLAPTQSIGYLKTNNSEKWLARTRKNGKYITHEIGSVANMSYQEAIISAAKFFDTSITSDMEYTVEQCIADYVEHLAITKSDATSKDAKARLKRHVKDNLRQKEITKLTKRDMVTWKNGLVRSKRPDGLTDEQWENKRRQSKDTANRILSQFKASLNLAYGNQVISNDNAWKTVTSFEDVSAGRPLLLTNKQVKKMQKKAKGQLQNLILAGIYTGARYGELAQARVSDFDADAGTLHLWSRKGKGSKIRERDVILSPDAVSFFKRNSRHSLPSAWLLVKDDGTEWKKSHQHRPIKALVKKAKLPTDTMFYSLRHYYISSCMNNGVPLLTVAKNCGTSIAMIEKTYGKVEDKAAREAFGRVALL